MAPPHFPTRPHHATLSASPPPGPSVQTYGIHRKLNRAAVLLDEAKELLSVRMTEARAAQLAADSITAPMWVKNLELRMVWCNREYEAQFGKLSGAYRGLFDADVWPANTAEQFMENDRMVMTRNRSWIGVETLPDGHPITVLKWPLHSEDGAVVGVAGMVLP